MMFSSEFIQRLVSAPSVRCNSPVKIYNPYLKIHMLVPCRKCSTCLDIRSSILSQRVKNECKLHPYSLFFTLTYDNAHLPVMCLSSCLHKDGVTYLSFDSNRSYCSLDYQPFRLSDVKMSVSELHRFSPRNFVEKNCFGYVDRCDVRNFLKRLRINILRKLYNNNKEEYNKNGKIRYFICSEYGPSSYRPHYHGIVWTDSKEVADFLSEGLTDKGASSTNIIYKSWQMCSCSKVTGSFVNSGAPQYVASYTNSYVDLPKVLQNEFTRPFVMASKNPVVGFSSNSEDAFCFALNNRTLEKGRFGESSDDLVSLEDFRSRFGFCKRCYQYDYNSFVLLFKKYLGKQYEKTEDGKSNDKFVPLNEYLNSRLYNVQDYYFVKKVSKWLSQSHTFFVKDSFDSWTGRVEFYDGLDMVFQMIRNFKRMSNKIHYTRVNLSSKYDCAWLSEYPNLLCSLPLRCDLNEFKEDFGLSDVEYSYLYNNGNLDTKFVKQLINKNVDYFKNKHSLHIKHSNCTKVFNDSQSHVFDDVEMSNYCKTF